MARSIRLLLVAAAALFWGAPALAQDVECDPGDREVRSLIFSGNRAFSDDDLARRISTTSSSWARRNLHLFGARRCLDSAELPRDILRLRLLYRNAGYYNTKVDTVVTPEAPDRVNVTFVIDEGAPIRIDSLSITGLDSVPNRAEIIGGLWLEVGKPFDVTRIAADHDTIVARLRNSGYPRAEVLTGYETRTDSLKAKVELTALPGPRSHIGDVLVTVRPVEGRSQEIPDRVVKKLLGVEQGDLYRDQDLVTAQRNLYQTGAYRFVEVAPVGDSLQTVGDSVVTLRVTLFEDYMRDLSTEVGWATLDCFRTRAQVTDKNFLGGARRLELTGQLSKIGFGDPLRTAWTQRNLCYYDDMHLDPFSDVLNYSVNATVRQPTVFGTFATPALSLFRERRGEYRAYLRTTYIGGEASLFKALQPTTSVRLAYSLEYGQTTAEPALLCAVFNRCDVASLDQIKSALPLAIASAAVARVRTDNAVNPRSGYLLRAESRNSATFIGSHPSLTFAKGVGDIAWYHPLGWGNVFAVRVRGGGIFGGGVENGTRLPPPQERLYAGGATSVRGFQQNELGELLYVLDPDVVRPVVLDDSTRFFEWVDTVAQRVVPVGGNSLLVANIDYRVRDPFFPALLQYTLFADVGSVWNRERRLKNLGFTPYWTPGIGVRVFSPVGPIQVNVGYNQYRQRSGPALYTPPISLVDQGFTSVYCAVPNGTSPSSSGLPLVHNRPDPDGTPHWIPDDVVCPPTFRPQERSNFWRRLVFTFSIGPDF